MVDLSFLKTFTKGNTTKMNRYISMYLKVAPEILDRMQQNIESQNWSDLAINAHSLKPQAEYMGIPALKEVLIEIENAVKSGRTTDLSVPFENTVKLHKEAAVFLADQIG